MFKLLKCNKTDYIIDCGWLMPQVLLRLHHLLNIKKKFECFFVHWKTCFCTFIRFTFFSLTNANSIYISKIDWILSARCKTTSILLYSLWLCISQCVSKEKALKRWKLQRWKFGCFSKLLKSPSQKKMFIRRISICIRTIPLCIAVCFYKWNFVHAITQSWLISFYWNYAGKLKQLFSI